VVSHYAVAPILISGEEQRDIVHPRTWAVIRCASPSQREAPITPLRIGASALPRLPGQARERIPPKVILMSQMEQSLRYSIA
jgi:hypothetical protein